MIVKVAKRGGSFQKAAAYYLHDKGALSQERVSWTETRNLVTNDPEKAWKIMAWTALHNEDLKRASGSRLTGQKLQKPVFSYSLSWHPEQNPTREEMVAQAEASLSYLGLSEHEALFVSHADEPHPHVHVITNTVHPESGLTAGLKFDRRRFQQWALAYEQENGKIYCPQREENAQKREAEQSKPKEERQDVRYKDPVILEAWQSSDSGQSFKTALESSGYELAQGNRRIVVVDHWGKAHNPVRYLEGVKTREFKARLSDLDLSALPCSKKVQEEKKQERSQEYQAGLAYTKWVKETRESTARRQEDEKSQLSQRHSKERAEHEEALVRQYKPEAKEQAIRAMEEKLSKKPGLLDRLMSSKNLREQEYRLLKMEHEEVKRELTRHRKALEEKQLRETTKQAERHQEEQKRQEAVIKDRKEYFEMARKGPTRELGIEGERGGYSGGRQRQRSLGSPPPP